MTTRTTSFTICSTSSPTRNVATTVRWAKSLQKSFDKKTPQMQAAIAACVKQLREDPHHPGLRTHKMGGTAGVFEARIDGTNRLTFYWDADVIVVENHCNHSIVSK